MVPSSKFSGSTITHTYDFKYQEFDQACNKWVGARLLKALWKVSNELWEAFQNTALVVFCPEVLLSWVPTFSSHLHICRSNRGHVLVYYQVSTPAKRCDTRHEVFERIFFRAHQGWKRDCCRSCRALASVGPDFWGWKRGGVDKFRAII